MNTETKESISETVTFSLPREILDDLRKIATLNEMNIEELLYSYVVEGIAGDSREARRFDFTEKANELLGKDKAHPKKFDEIFGNLVY